MMELVELNRVRDRVDLPSYRRCADRVTVVLHRLWRSAIFRRAACSSPRTRPYGTRDPAVHMRGPDAAHRCTAQMLRLQAPHRGSLGRSPRTHYVCLDVAKRKRRDHYRGWACELPGENHADLCGLTPDDGRARKPSLEPPAHLPVPFDENQLLLSDPPLDQRLGDTSGPAAEFDHRPLAPSRLHARACHRPGKRPRARHDPPDPVRARRPTPDEERDPGLHPLRTPADAGWEAAVCGESSSVIHGVRYCSTLYDYTAGGEALWSLTERSSKGVGDGR